MPPISFDQIGPNRRDPGHSTEYDGSGAPAATTIAKTLIIGIQASTSTEADATEVLSQGDPYAQFGNSPVANMVEKYRRIDKESLLYVIPLDEATGTPAAGSFAFAGTSTAAKDLTLRIGDRRYTVGIASGTTAAEAATSLTAEIAADDKRYMSGVLATATINVTALQDGTHGNDLTIDVESIPAGLTCTLTQPTGGAGDPDTADAIAAFNSNQRYDKVITQLNAATELAKLETEMDLRWTAPIGLEGMSYAAISDTLANTLTFGSNRNSKSLSVFGSSTSPTPTWIVASQVAARDAVMNSVPYTPRTNGWLVDVEAPPAAGIFDADGRNSLLFSGISTFKVDQSGRVYIDRLITTYQTDPSGNADIAYLEVALMHELALYGRRYRALSAEYDGFNLAADGTTFAPGVKVTTPQKIRGAVLALYDTMISEGRVQDYDSFEASLIVEPTGTNPYQVDYQTVPNFTVGLYRTRHLVKFQFSQ